MTFSVLHSSIEMHLLQFYLDFFIPVLMAVTILISENNSFSCRSFFPTVMNLLTELSLYIVLHVRFVICINCYYYYYSLTVLSLMIQRCM